MKTTIWHKLSEKKITSTSKLIIGPPICFGAGWTSLGRWLKNNGVPMIGLEVEVIFFSLNVCQMDVFFGFWVMVKYLNTLKKNLTTSNVYIVCSATYVHYMYFFF